VWLATPALEEVMRGPSDRGLTPQMPRGSRTPGNRLH
jgi:hypothetical protein